MTATNIQISCNLTEAEANDLRKKFPSEDEIQNLAEFFKVFGDPTRIRILFLLKEGEFCVHDIAAALNLNQTTVSHQLKSLRQARLVKYRKDGKQIFYALNDNHIDAIIAIGFDHLND